MLFLFAFLFSCLHHPPALSPEGCQAGDLAMCRALAAKAPDDPASAALDRWACDRGHVPSCMVLLSQQVPVTSAAAGLRSACDGGEVAACLAGAALSDDAKIRGDIGHMASEVCGAELKKKQRKSVAAACDRLVQLGWRSDEVREVEVIPKVYTVHAVLPGGTVLTVGGLGVSVFGLDGLSRVPMTAEAGHVDPANVKTVLATPEGDLLAVAIDPLLVWWMRDGRVLRLDHWPAGGAPVALAPDGSAVAAELGSTAGIATWSLPEGRLLGIVPEPKNLWSLELSKGGERLAITNHEGWNAAEPSKGQAAATRKDSWAPWLAGHDLPGVANARSVPSPDGRLIAVPEEQAVRLLDRTGTVLTTVSLPPLGGQPLRWSADSGQLAVPLQGQVAVISTRKARGDKAGDLALLQGIQAPPLISPAGEAGFAPEGIVDGVVTVGGAPSGGAKVEATPCSPGPAVRQAVADAAGHFVFENLPRGCWEFSATGVGGLPADKVKVAVGTEPSIVLKLVATTQAKGTVRWANGRPAAGATVRARLLDRHWDRGVATRKHIVTAVAKTDTKGRFTLDPAPAEGFQVEATLGAEGFVAKWTDAKLPMTLDLRPAIAVHATLDPNAGNYAEVVAQKVGERDRKGRVEPDGTWITTDFAPGDQVTLAVRQLDTLGPPVTVTLPVSGDVALRGPGFGRLHVLLPGRSAVDTLKVYGKDCEPTEDGCLTRWIPAGRYKVFAQVASDHRFGVAEVEVLPGQITEAPAPLSMPASEVRGRIVDTSGTPLAGVEVQAISVGNGDAMTKTGPDGRFQLSGLVPKHAAVPFSFEQPLLRTWAYGWVSLEQSVAMTAEGGVFDVGDLVLSRGRDSLSPDEAAETDTGP